MTKSEFPMLLSDFLHSSEGSRYKSNFEFDGDLVCGEPAPPIRVSKFGVSFLAFKGPSEHIPAKQWLENVVRESGMPFYFAIFCNIFPPLYLLKILFLKGEFFL